MVEIYILIYLLLFGSFLFFGRKAYYKGYGSYWKSITPIIILFTLSEGLRYGRGIDYYLYALHFDHPETITTTQDFGYNVLNTCLHYLNFSSVGAFIVYALITIVCLCILMKGLPEIWKHGYVIMLTALILQEEEMIRQFLAVSIIYSGLASVLENQLKRAGIIFIAGITIHYSSIIFVGFIAIAYYYKKIIPLKISIPAFILMAYILPADTILGPIGEYLNLLMSHDQESSYASYVNRSDTFLTSKAAQDQFARSITTTIINFIFVITMFIEGYYLVIKEEFQKYRMIYNLVVVGTIFFEFFHMFELFKRMFSPMSLLWFVIVGLIMANKRELKYSFSYYVVLLYVVAQAARFIFLPADEMFYFIWDK